MSASRLWLAILAALTTSVGHAAALDVEDSDPKRAPLGTATPFATLGVHGAFGTPNEILALYVYWTKPRLEGGEKGFAVRKLSRSGTSQSIEWATSFNCPGLEDVLVDLETIPLPSIDVPTVGRDDRQAPPTDGVSYHLWSRYPTWPDSFGYSVEMASNVKTPLAEWSDKFRQTLDNCWSPQIPEAAGRRP